MANKSALSGVVIAVNSEIFLLAILISF